VFVFGRHDRGYSLGRQEILTMTTATQKFDVSLMSKTEKQKIVDGWNSAVEMAAQKRESTCTHWAADGTNKASRPGAVTPRRL